MLTFISRIGHPRLHHHMRIVPKSLDMRRYLALGESAATNDGTNTADVTKCMVIKSAQNGSPAFVSFFPETYNSVAVHCNSFTFCCNTRRLDASNVHCSKYVKSGDGPVE